MGLRKVLGRPQQAKKEKVGLLVPGQGFQRLGMGTEVGFLQKVIKDVKEIIDPIQVKRVGDLMLINTNSLSSEEKTELTKEINRTDNAQLSLFLLIAAMWEEYRADEENIMPSVVLGHSGGEPIAGYIAGAFDLKNAAEYIFARGGYMNIANSLFRGGMAIVSSKDKELKMRPIESCLKGTEVEIANLNTPKKLVVSGDIQELEWVSKKLRERGLRASPLENVAGAYHHSKAMASVKKALDELFTSSLIAIKKPAIKWILNFSGALEDDVKKLKVSLPAQVVSEVKWRQGIETAIALGITIFIEIGPDQKLIEMLKDFPNWQKIQAAKQ